MSKRQNKKQITKDNSDPLDGSDSDEGSKGFVKADASVIKSRRIVTARRRGRVNPKPAEETEAPKAAISWDMNAFTGGNGFDSGASAAPDNGAEWGAQAATESTKTPEFNFGGPDGAPAPMTFSFTNNAASPPAEFSFTTGGGDGKAPDFSFGSGGGFGGNAASDSGGFGQVSFGNSESSFGVVEEKKDDEGGANNADEDVVEGADVGFAPMGGAPLVQVEEVAVSTGEEEETHAFPPTRSKLFEMDDVEKDGKTEKKWGERGIGKVSLNLLKSDPSKARILFRNEQVGTIRMNVGLFPGMKVEMAGEKGVKVSAMVDGKFSQYYVKFGKAIAANELFSEINKKLAELPPAGASAAPAAEANKAEVAPSPKKASPAPKPVRPREEEEKPTAAPSAQKKVKAQAEVTAEKFGVCYLEKENVGGVVTITGSSPMLVEATFEGLEEGKAYSLKLNSNVLGKFQGQKNNQSVFQTKVPVTGFLGQEVVLESDGAAITKSVVKIDEDHE